MRVFYVKSQDTWKPVFPLRFTTSHTMPSGTQKPKSVHKDIHTYKCNTKVKCTNRQLILQNNIFAVFSQPLPMSGRYGSNFTVYLPSCLHLSALWCFTNLQYGMAFPSNKKFWTLLFKKCVYWYFFWQIAMLQHMVLVSHWINSLLSAKIYHQKIHCPGTPQASASRPPTPDSMPSGGTRTLPFPWPGPFPFPTKPLMWPFAVRYKSGGAGVGAGGGGGMEFTMLLANDSRARYRSRQSSWKSKQLQLFMFKRGGTVINRIN